MICKGKNKRFNNLVNKNKHTHKKKLSTAMTPFAHLVAAEAACFLERLVCHWDKVRRKGQFYLDLHGSWGQGSDLLLHAVSNARVHGGTAGQHSVSVQVLTDVHVALHDAVEGGFMDSASLHT